MNKLYRQRMLGSSLCVMMLTLGCDAQLDSLTESDAQASMVLPTPRLANGARINNPERFELAVTVNGNQAQIRTDDTGRRIVSKNVRTDEELVLEVTWFDRSLGRIVTLFELSSVIDAIPPSGVLELQGSYTEPDYDGDGTSNFAELEAGEDIFGVDPDPFSLGPNVAPLTRLPPDAPRPLISNGYFEDAWRYARFVGVDGQLLHIDSLVIDDGAEAANGAPQYRWAGMHDDEFLYLLVLFEGARDDEDNAAERTDDEYTPHNDSDLFFDDDGLNVFIDGNNSQRRQLDGVDDLYIRVEQALNDEDPVEASLPQRLDNDITSIEGIEIGACLCRGAVTGWELKVPLSVVNITVGRPFGLELQIDQDLDGDKRDARWGWANPSINAQGADFRFESPQFNGLAVLTNEVKTVVLPTP